MDTYAIGGRTRRETDRLYRRHVERAWQTMVECGAAADSPVRDTIRHSWRRSLQLGLEPVSQRPRAVDGGGARLESLREANADLLQASRTTWQALGDILSQSQSCLLVADAAGTLLDVCGRPVLLDRAARDCIAPGYAWSELSAGTNAIGIALALNAPAEVFSAEHFLSIARLWSCSAAPVRDLVDGAIVGVVDITSFGANHRSHCLALAVTAAHQIEQTLQSRELARAVQLLRWYQTETQRVPTAATILVDRKGRVVTASDGARALFRDAEALERGRAFLAPGTGGAEALRCIAALPPRTRIVDLRGYEGRERAWGGGLLVLEAGGGGRSAPRVAPTVRAFEHLVGRHPALAELKRRAARIARSGVQVLLTGESGSGKESVARGIHRASAAAERPFVVVHCGALTTAETWRALFGDPRAAAAIGRDHELAEGTLFLKGIDELPPAAQLALLQALQSKVRMRIIAATERELEAEVAAGRFRRDLFYRLCAPSLRVPSLRERLSDLPLLVAHILADLDRRHGFGRKRAGPDLLALFHRYAWPGNVRELRAVLESAYVLAVGDELRSGDLPDDFPSRARLPGAYAPPPAAIGSISRMTRAAIANELAARDGNLSEVARRLGISRSTLYRKIKRYGLTSR